VRILVISDLHLGSRLGRDVLRYPEPLAALLGALEDVDRLVLLGDVVELMEGRASRAMAIAEPVLRTIGTAMGRDREIVLVPATTTRRSCARGCAPTAARRGPTLRSRPTRPPRSPASSGGSARRGCASGTPGSA
jgi:3',5'-cyclic AMP phosphodiesterase CpdA